MVSSAATPRNRGDDLAAPDPSASPAPSAGLAGDAGWQQAVRSPDQVLLEVPIAGPSSRMAAYALDVVLVSCIVSFSFLLLALTGTLADWGGQVAAELGELGAQPPSDGANELIVLMSFVALWMALALFSEALYFVFWECCAGGRSPGKRVLGLRVVRDGGRPLTFGASLVRNLLRFVDVLPSSYLVGLTSILATRDAKRLGDLAAGTIVVREDRPAAAVPHSVGEEPASEAEAGASLSIRREHMARFGREERALAQGALRRIDALSGSEGEILVERAVAVLCERLQYGDEVRVGGRRVFLRALLRAADRDITSG